MTEQRRKQEQAVRAAEVYRDQLLREGVTCILTYAAHMNNLTTSLTQHSQEQVGVHFVLVQILHLSIITNILFFYYCTYFIPIPFQCKYCDMLLYFFMLL